MLAAVASLWPAAFVLDRGAVEAGEVWRLWTGHLVHATTAHFAFDVGVGALVLLFVPWRRALLLLPPLVGIAVLGLRSDLALYTGFSGVLHGLTVLAGIHLARSGTRFERVAAALLLLGVVLKASVEALFGLSVFTSGIDMGGAVTYEAHLVGVVGGFLLAALDLPSVLRASRSPRPARVTADVEGDAGGAVGADRGVRRSRLVRWESEC